MINVADSQDVYKDVGQNVLFEVLEFKRENKDEDLNAFQEFITKLPSLINSLRIRAADDGLKVAFGISNQGWDYLFPDRVKPKELETFMGLKNVHEMPATGGDLFFHIRAKTEAVVYELMSQIMLFLSKNVNVLDETHGFRYFEGRAIIGFIDGTEAPAEQDAAPYALIGDEDPEYIDGSYAFAQKWIHDMNIWDHMKVEKQEKAIGRHKFNDIELDDNQKDVNAHNVAAKIEIDGVEQKIVRMNVPFSNPAKGETGTYFIGYSRHWEVTKMMLEQMIEKDDMLLHFSNVVTGQLFFIPSRSFIAELGD
ncbi:MAG: Dyp-type peroxidase [Lactobacillaceae bacterium]|jgi:putative iron-dependent peroxidase|nr:Dyp-type peroxidase [Lactobacillaceae bacterium]